MVMELAGTRVMPKPWGSTNLLPWSGINQDGVAIGELWFQRPDVHAPDPALLLKLLFTKEPVSIQVHPDDAFARSIGLERGKTEAWYILSAAFGSKVALGLKRQLTAPQLRASIEDGTIVDLVQWRRVAADEAILVAAGTIHAIGAGLVIAEIQQRSDTTFRLFDHGRARGLHVDKAVAASTAGPAQRQPAPTRLSDARTLLVANPHFVLERLVLSPEAIWELNAEHETWILVLEGHASIGPLSAAVGEAIFLQADRSSIHVGFGGLKALLAYSSNEPSRDMLRRLPRRNSTSPAPQQDRRATARPSPGPMEMQA